MNNAPAKMPAPGSTIMIVDDDEVFAGALARAMERRGYVPRLAHDFDSALASVTAAPPNFAVIDLRLPGGSGLMLVKRIRAIAMDVRVAVLTGFGSIATTVEAIKLGACYYLGKPASTDEVLAALRHGEPDLADTAPAARDVPSVYRVEWEHIHRVLHEQHGNISESARLLGIHRRTLQRKLAKHPVRR